MTTFIIAFSAFILLAGLTIVINPELIFRHLRHHIESLTLHFLAAGLRLILGICLVCQANLSKFPLIIEILGWLSILAAIVLTLMGRSNFLRLMNWALTFVRPFGRFGGCIAATVGGFLLYAFV